MSTEEYCSLFHTQKLKQDPELDNFVSKVEEISAVIKALASGDAEENEKGIRQADILLHHKKQELGDGDTEECQVKSDRTVINKCKDEQDTNVFMRLMEKDAQNRATDRKERKAKSDEHRKKGNISFAKKDFAGALKNYNQAIELIKDSPCLYNNRALTYIRLGLYSTAIEDCDKALRLEEFSLRARMFMAKSYFLKGEATKCREVLKEARMKLVGSVKLIDDYERDLFNMKVPSHRSEFDMDAEKKWQEASKYDGKGDSKA